MTQTPYSRSGQSGATTAGLNPRDALDILDVRTRQQLKTTGGNVELAASKDAGPDVLHYLATHGGAATRAAVAANGAAPAATNRLLAEDGEEDVRAELAAKIARLMPNLSGRESSHVTALTIETLECLARDASARVRAILAEEVKAMDCIPRDVALLLARDVNAIVAGPILQYSPLLSDADLMEIIACGQVSEILSAVAQRHPVNEVVSDALVQSLDVSAVATLLVNRDANIRKETLERIIDQAEQINAWHEPLCLRADLSARAVRRIAALVGASLIERLAARNDLSDVTRAHLNRALRARLAEPDSFSNATMPPAEMVARAKAENRLDGFFVEQAAQSGQRDIVVAALAELAQVPENNVRKILATRNPKPLIALVWHAHLSMRVAFKIQTFLLKLPTADVLPARDGVHFPLGKEEMRWHLGYFNIAV